MMFIKEFKHGNIHVKYEPDEIIPIEYDSVLVNVLNELDMCDTYMINEYWYNLSNYHCGIDLYNLRIDSIYTLTSIDIENLKNGKMIVLTARKPDKWERVSINEWMDE